MSSQSIFQKKRTIAVAGFILRAHPNSPQTAHRAFVFANAATNASCDIHHRRIKMNFDDNAVAGADLQRLFKNQSIGRIGNYPRPPSACFAKIISGGVLFGFPLRLVDSNCRSIRRCRFINSVANRRILLFQINRFGRHGTVFLTNNARGVHGPRQAAGAIHKRGSHTDGSFFRKFSKPQFFRKRNGTDGGSGANEAASSAVELATACAGAEI